MRYEQYRRLTQKVDGGQLVAEWDSATGQMLPRIPLPDPGAEPAADWWREVPAALAQMSWPSQVAAALCQRGVNHPADAGLTAAEWPNGTTPGLDAHLPRPSGAIGIWPQRDLDVPEEELGVWVAEGADPNVYGTAMVYATLDGVRLHTHTRWVLRLAGTSAVLAKADWNDTEACTELFRAAANGEQGRDVYLMQSAMITDPEAWAEERATAAQRHDRVCAARAFQAHPKKRVKPRLVEHYLRAAAAASPELTQRLRADAGRQAFANTVTLKGVNSGGRHENLHLAAKIVASWWRGDPRPALDPFHNDDTFAAELSRLLTVNGLGSLHRYRNSDGETQLVIVKDPELAFAHAAALGIPEHALVETYSGGRWVTFGNVEYPEIGSGRVE